MGVFCVGLQNAPPPSENWNFLWRTLCDGLLRGDYRCSSEDTVAFILWSESGIFKQHNCNFFQTTWSFPYYILTKGRQVFECRNIYHEERQRLIRLAFKKGFIHSNFQRQLDARMYASLFSLP